MANKRVAIYAGAYAEQSTTDNQLSELRLVASNAGWDVVSEFVDRSAIAAKGRHKHPEFDRLLREAAKHQFELIAVWSVDRLGRSLHELLAFIGEIHSKQINLYLHKQGIDTSTPEGKGFFQMYSVFAEFESSMIPQRVRAGIAHARAQGIKLGRPKVSAVTEQNVRRYKSSGYGILKIARIVGIGTGTVQRILADK